MAQVDKLTDFFHLDADGNLTRPKSARRISKLSCTRPACQNRDNPNEPYFKRCAKCKALYCSKGCQQGDWKRHKPICTLTAPESIKILRDISTSPVLRDHFAVLVILIFGLHLMDEKSLEALSSKPLEIDVHLQHEPADIKHFLHLLSGEHRWRDTPMMGIPQVMGVRFDKQEVLSDKWQTEQWSAFRQEELAKRPGLLAIIAVVRFHQTMGGRTPLTAPNAVFDAFSAGTQSILSFFKLSPRAFELAQAGVYPPYPVSFNDFKYEWDIKETSIENHIEFINLEIRFDYLHSNHLRLAAKLPQFEKLMVSSLCHPLLTNLDPDSAEFLDYLRKKIKKEHIYRTAAAYYECETDVIPKISSEDAKRIRITDRGSD